VTAKAVPGRRRASAAALAQALAEAKGLRSAAAQALGISCAALERAIARSKRLSALETELARANRDFAEAKLLKAVGEGKVAAIIFYLRNRSEGGDGMKREASAAAEAAAEGLDLGQLSDAELDQLEKLIEKACAAKSLRAKRGPRKAPRGAGTA
jgi:hypothetical protein